MQGCNSSKVYLKLITDQEYKLRYKYTYIVLSQSVSGSVKRGVTFHEPKTEFIVMDYETQSLFS